MSKTITLLGSTGSIGTQSLDVIKSQGYNVFGLAAYSNVDLLLTQIQEFKPKVVCITNENAFNNLKTKLENVTDAPTLLSGMQGLKQLAEMPQADILINAVVGIAGLESTLAALKSGKDVALANKESLVTGGYLVTKAVKEYGAKLLPVDSEHSAIFQCIQDKHSAAAIDKILLTASGGPFFGYTKKQLETVTKLDALKHPNWAMGNKITIDSATLMNKGLEFIEAAWLFDLPADKIEIVVQRQSIIHSMVQFVDNSILAQLGVPDMRIPIQYALTYPNRCVGNAPKLDFSTLKSITFDQPDQDTFTCLKACKTAISKGGLAPCAANGANEKAVELFLNDKISFLKIGELVSKAVDLVPQNYDYSLQDVFECDKWARQLVCDNI